jgi:hypothetical protein
MHHRQIARTVSLGAAMALILGFAVSMSVSALPAEEEVLPLNLTAVAANIGARGPHGQTRIDINVTRWSSDEERVALLEALKDPASRSLPDALRDQESTGRLRQIQGLGHDLRYARMIPTEDGGMVVILASDRRIAFAEAARNTRSMDNNVSLVQLTLDADGNGEGQLLVGAEMVWNEEKNQLTIESLSSEPVRLGSIKRR